jgi:hypothetical protein
MTDPLRPPNTGNDRHMENDRESTGIPRWAKVVGTIVAVVALLVIVMMLADGTGGHKRPGGSSDQSPGATFTANQQAEFVQCMREQGIDFRSRVGENGQVQMSPGPGVDVNGAAFRKAQAACRANFTPRGGQSSGGRP